MRAVIAAHIVLSFVVFAPVVAFGQPTVAIYADSDSYEAGDTIEISLAGENSGNAAAVDVYIGLITRDGAIHTLGEGGWTEGIEPWLTDVQVRASFAMGITPFEWLDLPCAMPPINWRGEYSLAAVLTHPGTFDFLSEPSLAPLYYHGTTDIKMVSIPAGSFVMGPPEDELGRRDDEGPQRSVNVSGFLISETEITQRQWEEVMRWNDSYHEKDESFAIEQVTWLDCLNFCNKLSDSEGLTRCYTVINVGFDEMHLVAADISWDTTANGYRLPTEAEWEYACRAGTTGRFSSGSEDSDLARAAWYSESSGYELRRVGEKEPNAFGLFDMHGNNWEWCWDWHDIGYYGSRPEPDNDPRGPDSGLFTVYRGGGHGSPAWCCRSAVRGYCSPGTMCVDIGFRIARSQ